MNQFIRAAMLIIAVFMLSGCVSEQAGGLTQGATEGIDQQCPLSKSKVTEICGFQVAETESYDAGFGKHACVYKLKAREGGREPFALDFFGLLVIYGPTDVSYEDAQNAGVTRMYEEVEVSNAVAGLFRTRTDNGSRESTLLVYGNGVSYDITSDSDGDEMTHCTSKEDITRLAESFIQAINQ